MADHAIRPGCVVTFDKAYFEGSHRKPKFRGKARIKALVVSDSYGMKTGQHTFTLKVLDVLETDLEDCHKSGDRILIKGRNLYKAVVAHIQGEASLNTKYSPRGFEEGEDL